MYAYTMVGLLIFLFSNFALVAGLRVGATASRAWRAGLSPTMSAVEQEGRLKVMIAGGGIGGLCTALVLRKQGHKVHVYEKTSKYRPFGGPIQIASNALESIKRIDNNVYNAILERSTGIGERKNGLKDGISNEWFATFDLFAPARRRGQDSSVVIDRPILQDILLNGIGEACITKGCEVVGYEKHQYHVVGKLSNGTSVEVPSPQARISPFRACSRLQQPFRTMLTPTHIAPAVRPANRVGRDQIEGARGARAQPDRPRMVGLHVLRRDRKVRAR